MFTRFKATLSRLQVSLRESRRIADKVKSEHIASLGSIAMPMTIAGRVAFWTALHERLAKLANRINAEDQAKIIGAIHARVPMVTIEEQRTLQRENAEADLKFWTGHKDYEAGLAEDLKGMGAKYQREGEEAEAQAKTAAEHGASAKDRLDRLDKGEDLPGGLGKPMTREDAIKIMKSGGLSDSDIRHCVNVHGLHEIGAYDEYARACHKAHDRATRAEKSIARKMLRKRGART